MRNAYRWPAVLALFFFLGPLQAADEWIYRVRAGDNLWNLTEKYMVSMRFLRRLQKLNHIAQPRAIPPGTRLRMPVAWSKIDPAGATVIATQGQVVIENGRNGTARTARKGDKLHQRDRLRTAGEGNVLLEFADGSRLLLNAGSELQLERLHAYGDGDIADTRLRMERGRSETTANPRQKKGTRFEIDTPSAMTAVRGTGFRVGTDAEANVSHIEVTQGRVRVSAAGTSRILASGFGTVARRGEPPRPPVKLLSPPPLETVPTLFEAVPFGFELAPLPGALSFRVQIAAGEDLNTLFFDGTFPADGARIEVPELADGHYVMRVRGIDAAGIEGRNGLRAFTLNARPEPPFNVTPTTDAAFAEQKPAFRWTHPETAASYRFQLADNVDFRTPLLDTAGLRVEQLLPERPLQPGTYFWRVSAYDSAGEPGPSGPPRRFRVLPRAPETEPPALDDQGLTFQWRPGQPGQRYRFQLAVDPTFEEPLVATTTDKPRYHIADPKPGRYYMRVKTVDVDGVEGPFGGSQSIEVPGPDRGWVVLIPVVLSILFML